MASDKDSGKKSVKDSHKGCDDFTTYLPANEAGNYGLDIGNTPSKDKKVDYSKDTKIKIESERNEPGEGRALVCWCNGRKKLSVTVRRDDKPDKKGERNPQSSSTLTITAESIRDQLNGTEYQPKGGATQTGSRKVSVQKLCDTLWELIFQSEKKASLPSGLLVIAGRTGSAKSQTARGLIYKLLTDDTSVKKWLSVKSGRRPHLLTLEDPIEARLYASDPESYERFFDTAQEERLIDYTPRDRKEEDFASISDALLKDALRQTPTVVYVGEVRASEDWKAILEFAGTGHLIITTSHSGSVTETLGKMFDALGAKQPEEIGRIAQRILGVVHQGTIELEHNGTNPSALIPTMWRQTSSGIASLVSEGLASVLPHFPEAKCERNRSSLGRRWFVSMLLRDLKDREKDLFDKFDLEAFGRDLEGM